MNKAKEKISADLLSVCLNTLRYRCFIIFPPLRVTSDLIFSHCKTQHSRAECFNYRDFLGGGCALTWPPKKRYLFRRAKWWRPPITSLFQKRIEFDFVRQNSYVFSHKRFGTTHVMVSARRSFQTTNQKVRLAQIKMAPSYFPRASRKSK